MRVAILDDYQDVTRSLADWSAVEGEVEIEVFTDHLSDEHEIAARLKGFEAVLIMRERTPFRHSQLEKLPDLKLLVTTGMRNASVDVAAAEALGITACGTGAFGGPTADLAWGLILALARHIPEEDRRVRSGGWQKTVGVGLEGKTLGVAGLGKLGGKVATIGKAFGMNVIAWSQNLTAERCAELGVELVGKQDLMKRSDVLSIHLVLSDRTRGLFGAAELALMKPTAYLVNTARGPIVDEDALVEILQKGAIAGAGLDVFGTEPLPAGHPFRSLPNTVITPHLGYVEEDNYRAYFKGYVAAIRGYLDGKPVNQLSG